MAIADFRYFGPQAGVVVDNRDPLQIGRLKVRVEGLLEPSSGWSLPFGIQGGGDTNSGAYDIPKIGAEVIVFFIGGNPDKARWTYGHWGRPEGISDVPEPARSILEEDGAEAAELIKAHENDRFQVFTDLREGKGRFVIRSKRQDLEDLAGAALMIEVDDESGTISISAPSAVSIKALGTVDIDALSVTILGRQVLPLNKPI